MPNRTILFATALFLVLVIGFIVSPRSSSSPKANSNQDFTIIIPEPEYNVPQGGSVHEEITEPIAQLSDLQQQQALQDVIAKNHITVSSAKLASHKQWFPLDFLGHETFNPNVLAHPHPLKGDQLIMIAQETNNVTGFFTELACAATFKDGALKCLEEPIALPVASSVSDKCNRKLEPFNYLVGPHDARAFYGPDRPYLLYGSPSSHTCMGMWMQDLSRLMHWDYQERLDRHQPFFLPTDLQRPHPYGPLEKNWFPFWNRAGELFLHYNVAPKRIFAKVNSTGGVGPDLAPAAYANDEACIAKYMPKITHPGYEHIHQTTNSLMVTLCNREDPTCFESEDNTFIMTIVHHKMSFGHDVYEPYIMLFRRTAPFELHAISKVPFRINGQGRSSNPTPAPPAPAAPAAGALGAAKASLPPTIADSTTSQTKGPAKRAEEELHYITSVNWAPRGNNYQGYLNHDLLISFGIGDRASGAIDVSAAELLDMKNFGICGS